MEEIWVSKNDVLKKRENYFKNNDFKNVKFCDLVLFNFCKIEEDLKRKMIIFPELSYSKGKIRLFCKKIGFKTFNILDNNVNWYSLKDINNRIHSTKYKKLLKIENFYKNLDEDIVLYYNEKYNYIKLQSNDKINFNTFNFFNSMTE